MHRLRNALDVVSSQPEESALLEDWLMHWSPDTTPTTVGIPVGQYASNLLAEALLIEVDDYLEREHVFIRYVDDYYIFCDSRSQALATLYDLGERLLRAERLNLNSAKTRVQSTAQLASELKGFRSTLADLQNEFVESVLGGDPYGHIDSEQLDAEMRKVLRKINAPDMLEESLANDTLDIQKFGFALQVLGALGDSAGIPLILKQLPVLGAVSRQIGLYLNALTDALIDLDDTAGHVLAYIRERDYVSPYQAIWLLEPFVRSAAWGRSADILKVLKSSNDVLVRRQALLAASHSRKRHALVDVKQSLAEGPWLRRAALFGARHLPADERKHSWGKLSDKTWTLENCVERAVVLYAKAELERESAKPTFDPDEIPF